MYEYRRMTPEQQKAVLAERKARGLPLHKPPHFEQGDGWYFISAATYEHRAHFSAPKELTALSRRLLEALAGAGMPCAGWVVMPTHYHLLARTTVLHTLGRAVGVVHGRSSHYANLRDKTPGRRIWYKYTDRRIRSDRHFWTCLHYILFNPVKHGYAGSMAEWRWSSYHDLLNRYGPEWIEDLVRSYPLPGFGRDWDDFEDSLVKVRKV
jgi:putative transposase